MLWHAGQQSAGESRGEAHGGQRPPAAHGLDEQADVFEVEGMLGMRDLREVADLPDDGRLVLVAGPSSSGKTSFAKRLMVQLRVLGYAPFAVSLDDYFVDREQTPRTSDGDFDFDGFIDEVQISSTDRSAAGSPIGTFSNRLSLGPVSSPRS